MAPNAFVVQSGRFRATLMKETRAPITSRWASILLRRALLSATDTPRDIGGADWVAERAWQPLRMGEADSARLLVQSVESDRRSEEHTSELQSTMRNSYAVFCLKKNTNLHHLHGDQ